VSRANASAEDRPGLVRAIGRWDLTAAIVNGVIGSAVFGMPATLVGLTGAWSPLAALFAGLGFLVILLCFAEVASRFRDPGGPYLYAREAFGPLVGFEVGWLTFWTRALSAAANLNVFVLYFAQLVPAAGAGIGRVAVMVAIVGIVTAINVIGVRQATWTIDLFTLAKLSPLLLLIVLGLPRLSAEVLATQAVARTDWPQAILLLVYAYGGFEAALIPAGEARDPERDTAFALLAALGIIAFVYMLVQLVVAGVVPRAAEAEAPIAAAFAVLLGSSGVVFASVAAMLSVYGWTIGSVLQSSRLFFSMAERGELPAAFARVHPRFRTPHVAIVAYSLLALGCGLWGTFASNAVLAAIVRLVYYGLTCAALLVFRRRAAEEAGFRLRFAELVAPLGMLLTFGLLAKRPWDQVWPLLGLAILGLLLYGARRRT
jgi:amino acid transporter